MVGDSWFVEKPVWGCVVGWSPRSKKAVQFSNVPEDSKDHKSENHKKINCQRSWMIWVNSFYKMSQKPWRCTCAISVHAWISHGIMGDDLKIFYTKMLHQVSGTLSYICQLHLLATKNFSALVPTGPYPPGFPGWISARGSGLST